MIPAIAATRFANIRSVEPLLLLAFVFVTSCSGCMGVRGMLMMNQRDPMSKAPRLSCGADPRLEDVVAHLNRNTNQLHSWRANNVKIRTKGVPVTLSGQLAVEKAHRVRLRVTSPMGTEFDLGSNDERFWIWSRQPEPVFVTCKHENIDVVRQSYGIPFEPSWLMEALGVAPLPTTGVQLEMLPNKEELRLVQQFFSAHGKPLRRVVIVNLKRGGIVTEHSLYDSNASPIAIAKLGAHHYENGIVLPHRVELNWPGNQLSVTMDLGKVEINPPSISSQVFEMQEHRGCELIQLDANIPENRMADRTQGDSHPDHTGEPSGQDGSVEFLGHDGFPEVPLESRTGIAHLSDDEPEFDSATEVEEEATEDWEWAR